MLINMNTLQREQAAFLERYQQWIDKYLEEQKRSSRSVKTLLESMSYSLQLPGKRFRPFLSYLVWKAFNQQSENSINILMPWCLAIEFIHTYSLVHDDLPCMDNDDFRRGKPSNHKVFGEDIALLAGDALLTEAFFLISNAKDLSAEIRLQLINLLSEKIGLRGMVAGQVLDMKSDSKLENINLKNQLQKIHLYKTGFLIEAAALGGAIIARANQSEQDFISEYAQALGLAFQIKDDLMDASEKQQDNKNYVSIYGLEETKKLLQQVSQQALSALKRKNDSGLVAIIEQNIYRET